MCIFLFTQVCVLLFYLLKIWKKSKLLTNCNTSESKLSLYLGVFIPNKTFFLLRILVLKNLSWQYNLEFILLLVFVLKWLTEIQLPCRHQWERLLELQAVQGQGLSETACLQSCNQHSFEHFQAAIITRGQWRHRKDRKSCYTTGSQPVGQDPCLGPLENSYIFTLQFTTVAKLQLWSSNENNFTVSITWGAELK